MTDVISFRTATPQAAPCRRDLVPGGTGGLPGPGTSLPNNGLQHVSFPGAASLSYANFTAQRVKGGLWSGCDPSLGPPWPPCVWKGRHTRNATSPGCFHTPAGGWISPRHRLEGADPSPGCRGGELGASSWIAGRPERAGPAAGHCHPGIKERPRETENGLSGGHFSGSFSPV